MTPINAIRNYLTIAILCGLCVGLEYRYENPWKHRLTFDDAYMFTRYARNFRDGLGISWNLDGVHTFGLTCVPWMFCVLPALAVWPAGEALQRCSCIAGAVALTALAFGLLPHVSSRFLKNPFGLALTILFPITLWISFRYQLMSGMDTMAAVGANAILVGFALIWQRDGGNRWAVLTGLSAFAATAIRLDSGLDALVLPTLLWLSLLRPRETNEPVMKELGTHASGTGPPRPSLVQLGLAVGLPMFLIGADLLLCRSYFGMALPASFYVKATNRIAGFTNPEVSGYLLRKFLQTAIVPIVFIPLLAEKRDLRRFWPFLFPCLITILYLMTVRQVMGLEGRFFWPQLPFLMAPAILILDRRLNAWSWRGLCSGWPLRLAALGAIVGFTLLTEHVIHSRPKGIPTPTPYCAAKKPLPTLDWFDGIHKVSELARNSLPNGSTIAATEVGFLGEDAPGCNVIDMVGLNDSEIVRHGFSMDYLLSHRPEIIWLPHPDYTGLNALILGDRRLLEQYVVIKGAFSYGIAIRKGPHFRKLLMALEQSWKETYPDRDLRDYVVTRIDPPGQGS